VPGDAVDAVPALHCHRGGRGGARRAQRETRARLPHAVPDVDLPAAPAVPDVDLPAPSMREERLPLRGACSRGDQWCGDPRLPAAVHAEPCALPSTLWWRCNAVPAAVRNGHRRVPAASVPCHRLLPVPRHGRAVPLPPRRHVRARAVPERLPTAPTTGPVHHIVPTPPVPSGRGDRVPAAVHAGKGHRLPSGLRRGGASSRLRPMSRLALPHASLSRMVIQFATSTLATTRAGVTRTTISGATLLRRPYSSARSAPM
jgi:hypothetical protein